MLYLKIIVVVESQDNLEKYRNILYSLLSDLHEQELSSLKIGHSWNKKRLTLMNDIYNALCLLELDEFPMDEKLYIAKHFEKIYSYSQL